MRPCAAQPGLYAGPPARDLGDTVDIMIEEPALLDRPRMVPRTAVAAGRRRLIRRYLERLERAEVLDPERAAMAYRLASLRRLIADCSNEAKRASLIAERQSVEEAMWAAHDRVVVRDRALETGFVESALGYSRRKGISPEAWRLIGVPDEVLRRAGLLEEAHQRGIVSRLNPAVAPRIPG